MQDEPGTPGDDTASTGPPRLARGEGGDPVGDADAVPLIPPPGAPASGELTQPTSSPPRDWPPPRGWPPPPTGQPPPPGQVAPASGAQYPPAPMAPVPANVPPATTADRPGSSSERLPRRGRWIAGLALLVLVPLVGVGVALWLSSPLVDRELSQAEQAEVDEVVADILGTTAADRPEGLRAACEAGHWESCDRLYSIATPGSEDQAFGDSCGDRNEPAGCWPQLRRSG